MRHIFRLILVLVLAGIALGQVGDEREFAKQGWDKFDFAKRKVTKAQLARLKYGEDDVGNMTDELAIVRGILFGKRGRIFVEKTIQNYLEKQPWYKPNPNYRNSLLTPMERTNLDLIRAAEAERHNFVEPGDLRFWRNRLIPEEKIYAFTGADWQVMIAEIEAVHGKTFPDQEWLQKYFDQRYWYKRNPNYSPSVLNEFERKNLEAFVRERDSERRTAVSVGDMDKFRNTPLTRELLKGVTLNDLRLMRFEFFARRGKRFAEPGFRQVFEWRDWYRPLKNQKLVKLGRTEEQNVRLIEQIEAELREQIATSDVTEEMLNGLFVEDLRVLRNEIYARRGRIFKDKELQKYFASQPWYKADADFRDEMLTELEKKNLATIKAAEEVAISKFVLVEG